MATNIVCSDTYVDAFSKLDKKAQKKSLETMRLMQKNMRSDGLKVEKLNTKLDFKSARVTQDYRAIFTQSGNTVLLVYVDHHDDAYAWANRRLQGFDVDEAKPAFEYFEKNKKEEPIGKIAGIPIYVGKGPGGGAQCITLVLFIIIILFLVFQAGVYVGTHFM